MRFAAARREYECGFCALGTISENMNLLRKMIAKELRQNYLNEGDEIIYDETSSYVYDQNVSIASIGIQNGTVLMVY